MKLEQPVLQTARLFLRPFIISDAPVVTEWMKEKDIASTTCAIPYPYSLKDAKDWINKRSKLWKSREESSFAIVIKETQQLIGGIELRMSTCSSHMAEMGYWIAKPFWKQGYATESASCLLDWGFRFLKVERIYANHFGNNPASGKVLQNIGMKHEGTLRNHLSKWGVRYDSVCYGILVEEWLASQSHD